MKNENSEWITNEKSKLKSKMIFINEKVKFHSKKSFLLVKKKTILSKTRKKMLPAYGMKEVRKMKTTVKILSSQLMNFNYVL